MKVLPSSQYLAKARTWTFSIQDHDRLVQDVQPMKQVWSYSFTRLVSTALHYLCTCTLVYYRYITHFFLFVFNFGFCLRKLNWYPFLGGSWRLLGKRVTFFSSPEYPRKHKGTNCFLTLFRKPRSDGFIEDIDIRRIEPTLYSSLMPFQKVGGWISCKRYSLLS